MSPRHIRIISLLPSGTEIISALGLGTHLVGRSHECDFPEEVLRLPVCSEPKFRSDGTGAEISRETENILRFSLSVYKVDAQKIKTLSPTHIFTQSQCAVCSVSTAELRNALKEFLNDHHITVMDSNPETLEDVLSEIREVAGATGVPAEGKALVRKMTAAFEGIQRKTGNRSRLPSVAILEWVEPLMTAGHWMMELIKMAGGGNSFPDENKRWISLEDLAEKNPDKILIAPCGFSIARTEKEMHFLENRREWKTLKAVRSGEIYLCDGNHYFNRPGPRLTDSLEILAEIFHPDIFPAKHHGSGWIRRTD